MMVYKEIEMQFASKMMAGNDTPTGVGRGTSRGISGGRRVRGTTLSSGRGMAATTPSHSIVGQASNPSTSHTTISFYYFLSLFGFVQDKRTRKLLCLHVR